MKRLVSLLAMVSTFFCLAGVCPAAGQLPFYDKQADWAGTMLASRAKYLAWRAEQRQAAGNPAAAKEVSSEALAGEGPGQALVADVTGCRSMRLVSILEQGGGNCHIWGDARLIAQDGSVTWLGDLQPTLVRVGWGRLIVDRNWQDEPLRIGGKTFAHGIWVHANSNVCYRLDGKYTRFEAWVGMDAARAKGVARFKVLFDDPNFAEELWRRVAADFPGPARCFAEDAGKNYLDWFQDARNTQFEQAAFARAIYQLGRSVGPLQQQIAQLRRDNVPADDRRWLDLYQRARRVRQTAGDLDKIWIEDLRRPLEAQVQALLAPGVSPDDPRWADVTRRVGQIMQTLPKERPLDLAALATSLARLAGAAGERYPHAAKLWAQVQQSEPQWRATIAAAVAGNDAALKQLTTCGQQWRTVRQEMLAGLPGMEQFLAQPAHTALPEEWERQYETLRYDLGNRAHFAKVAAETYRPEALIQESDRDPADVVLRRTAALLRDLKLTAAGAKVAAYEPELQRLEAARAAVAPQDAEARYLVYADACRLRRQIALCNPRLDFNQVLFVKRHRGMYNHMCDQYYGMTARPGGGVFVLAQPFGPRPELRDLLADSRVENGRLKGQPLIGGTAPPPDLRFDGQGNLSGPEGDFGGSFLSPDLSYDGRQLLFAYVEGRGDRDHRHHTDPSRGHWAEGRCYHIFQANLDGTRLVQLTDGTWNDFDPCWLPNGRIAFISERRGGYLRCGRTCPNYNLYDMAADGSDMMALSFHETNEWHPSVTHDGRIIYTRWDYVDRFGCTAHLPWITTLDGRDSRALHGNFAPRQSRPDMELDCRAIPDSQKFVATAAPHHSQSYGSLVLIDPRVPDDDGMAPVRRITPEVGFPESQGGFEAYGSAWPLSDDYFLCVYDPTIARGQPAGLGNYGVYLVDAFGNKELLYRDPTIGCVSPLPVQSRRLPPALPEVVTRGPDSEPVARTRLPAGSRPPEATVGVVNVYDSLKPWPAGSRIKEIRVLQLLPMSVPSGRPPHDTALRTATAHDSVVPVRYVLGTVPVEDDGSAHFVVPANREIFFQALDERGMAVQSMRSATYLHAGEQLVCTGCHEPKHRAPEAAKVTALAMLRAPSRLTPDVDGSNPFSYPRLVQPVLDRHCVECHAKSQDKKALNLGREPLVRNWYASYNSLVGPFGFHDYGDGYRTTPGRFGAKAARLIEILEKGHYDVTLSAEEFHRLTLWLDCSSMFYGVYEKEGGEAQLRGEIARPTLE